MSSAFALLAMTCLLASAGNVVGTSGRALKQSSCPTDVCDAVARRDPNTLSSLIAAGRTTCTCTCNGNPLLHASVPSECRGCVDHLTAPPSNCNINSRDGGGNTPLHDAAAICQIVMGDHLLNRGASVTAVNRGGLTPLCLAARQNNPDCGHVVRSIVSIGGADICARCNGMTPLEFAVNDNVRNVLIQDGGADC